MYFLSEILVPSFKGHVWGFEGVTYNPTTKEKKNPRLKRIFGMGEIRFLEDNKWSMNDTPIPKTNLSHPKESPMIFD